MKVKCISRNPDDYQRETKMDIPKLVRNWNAPQDPFRAQTEYTRALNATKLERVFARPFIASLDGHLEGVSILAKHPGRPSTILSAAADGQVKIWALANKSCLATIQAHHGPVRGISIDTVAGDGFVSVGHDEQIKYWRLPHPVEGDLSEPAHSIPLNGVAHSITHIAKSSDFATSGDDVSVWRLNRDSPIRTYNLGPYSIHFIRANPIEEAVMIGAMSDRSIFVLDTRQKTPLKKVTMKLRPNSLTWNPLEPFTFAVASDDYKDVYHTKRMSNVLSVLWSMDNKFVLSGSNEMNIRVWKAKAAEKLGPLCPREKAALQYSEKLREQFKEHPEIRRIAKHRQVPKSILSASREHATIRNARSRKEFNRRRAQGIADEDIEFVPEVKKSMVASSGQ